MRLSNWLIAASISVLIGHCGSTFAQSFDPKPAMGPVVDSRDARGVDMANGRFYLTLPALSTAGMSKTGTIATTFSPYDSYHWAPFFDDNVGAWSNQNPFAPTAYNFFSYDGGSEIFNTNGTASAFGSRNYLTSDSLGTNYVLKDGSVLRYEPISQNVSSFGIFAAGGLLTKITRPDGEVISFKYMKPNGQAAVYLKRVTSNLGWILNYDYSPTNINDGSGKIYILNNSIDYCSNEQILSSTPQNTCAILSSSIPPTQYYTVNMSAYDFTVNDYDHNVIVRATRDHIYKPSGQSADIYYNNGRVSRIQIGGAYWDYTYNTDPLNFSTTIKNAYGYFKTIQTELIVGRIVSNSDEIGYVTKYSYNMLGLIENVMPPETTFSGTTPIGGYTHYNYDERRNVETIYVYPKGGGSALTTAYTYEYFCLTANVCYDKVASITDSNGKVTTYTYSHVHGGILTETLPADVNGVTPQTRYTYAALVPKVRDGTGAIINSTPVYRVTEISKCASSTNSCAGTADETKTIFEYDLDHNLLLKSQTVAAGNANLALPPSATNLYAKTSFTYNYAGFVTSVDGPRTDVADVTYVTYDHRYRPVFEIGIDPDGSGPLKRVIIRHRYDVDGNEKYTDTGVGNATDGSDFILTSYVEKTYDPTNGTMIRSRAVAVTQP